jgi:hypothetical protein
MDDRSWVAAVRSRQDDVREAIGRERLAAALRARRRGPSRWRRALGRWLVGFGRAIEGDRAAEQASLPCA